jgi:hypothetical protein
MPVREEITYILVHDRMPDHPKIKPLTDGAFRLLISCWCWCGEHVVTDGHVETAVWLTMGTKNTRAELVRRKLVEEHDGHVEVHDWLDIQRSAAEVERLREEKSKAGKLGNHRRHHVAKRIVAPDCSLCLKGVVA